MLLNLVASLLSSIPGLGPIATTLATTVNAVLSSIPLLGGLLAGLI
jgi:hypothetical protein